MQRLTNKYYFYFDMSIVISEGQFKQPMEGQDKNQNEKIIRKPRKKVKLDHSESQGQQKKQNIDSDPSQQADNHSQDSSGWSSEIIEPAIKSMAFRPKRGTRMKQLIKGKHKKDLFWEKYQNYFGGDLNRPEESEDQEDYQASSSGRDQFDSDFDLTDSYVGKRGRKKGTKLKRRRRQPAKTEEDKDQEPKPKGRRGRKRKVPLPGVTQLNNNPGQQLKKENLQLEFNDEFFKKKIIFEITQIKRQLPLLVAAEQNGQGIQTEIVQATEIRPAISAQIQEFSPKRSSNSPSCQKAIEVNDLP